jgi:hypothetical protein
MYSKVAELVAGNALLMRQRKLVEGSSPSLGANLTSETNNPQHSINTMKQWQESEWFNQWLELAQGGR